MNISSPILEESSGTDSVEAVSATAEGKLGASGGWTAGVIGLGLLFLFGWQLHGEWSANPRYAFGWGVPFLGMALAWGRWKDRPSTLGSGGSKLIFGMTIAAMILWLPIRVLREANMDWRLLEWVVAGGIVGLLLGLMGWMGGKANAQHFAVPVLFLFLAVPWPTAVENWVVQGLSAVVVRGVVEALRWGGVAAWSTGSLIHVPGTTIGVEEACSGIAALQGALMCAVFVGEQRRMRIGARLLMVGIGVGFAVLLNFVRTFWLSWTAIHGGKATAEALHDGAGITALVLLFALLWAVARFLPNTGGIELGKRKIFWGERKLSPYFLGACAVWFVSVEIVTAQWYSTNETALFAPVSIREAKAGASLEAVEIPDQVRSILRYDEGTALRGRGKDGSEWWVHDMRWEANGAGANLARYHSPEICLPAAGFERVTHGRVIPVNSNLAFRYSTYQWMGRPVHVFSSYRSANDSVEAVRRFEDFDLTWKKRLASAAQGRRVGAQQVLQVTISGAANEATAVAEFLEFARGFGTGKKDPVKG